MSRATPGHATRQRRKRVLKDASGFWGSRSKLFRVAKEFVTKAGVYAYRDRRTKKRNFRSMWIIRITAACEARGISYSKFIGGLKRIACDLNRKMLSEIAISDPAAFDKLVEKVRSSGGSAAA